MEQKTKDTIKKVAVGTGTAVLGLAYLTYRLGKAVLQASTEPRLFSKEDNYGGRQNLDRDAWQKWRDRH